MDHERRAVESHYGDTGLAERILAAMRAAGADPARDGVETAPPLDHLHLRSRPATEELIALADPRPGERVLDAGSGLGGPSRLLAVRGQCRVLGVDLTREYCRSARLLSAAFGVADATRFVLASATRLPVRDAAFDVVWTQHAQMNIRDKERFYRELARALAPRGRLVFHDIFAGPAGDPPFPLPWAETRETSWLVTADRAAEILASTGLRRVHWQDRTEESARWARQIVAERATAQGPVLTMGRTAPAKLTDLRDGLEGDRLRVVTARWERA